MKRTKLMSLFKSSTVENSSIDTLTSSHSAFRQWYFRGIMAICRDLYPLIFWQILPTRIVHWCLTSVVRKHDESFRVDLYPTVSKRITDACFVKPEEYETVWEDLSNYHKVRSSKQYRQRTSWHKALLGEWMYVSACLCWGEEKFS